MRAVIQRVSYAAVTVGEKIVGEISKGLLIFLGVGKNDADSDSEWLIRRITQLRIFEDAEGRINQSLADVEGSVLLISQFTLYASLKKGNRPSFNRAALPDQALLIYEKFERDLSTALGKSVQTGCFGAEMQIEAHHAGPVTLVIDTKERNF